jgi:hypothetical protein
MFASERVALQCNLTEAVSYPGLVPSVVDKRNMTVERKRMTLTRENRSTRRKTCHCAILSKTKLAWTGLRLKTMQLYITQRDA